MIINRQSAWLMSFYIIFFYAYYYIMLMLPYIQQGNVCNIPSLGEFRGPEIFTMIFLLGYVIGHIPIGLLMDKYGPKYVVSASVLITVMGNYMMLSSSELTFYVLGRFLTGFGSAAAIIGWFKIITMSYAKQDFIKVMGITTFICFLIIFGLFYLIDHLKQVVEWRTIILMLSLLGIVISLIFFIFTPVGYSHHIKEDRPKVDFKLIFFNRRILRLFFLGFFVFGPLWGFCEGWGKNYFCEVYLMNEELASIFSYLMSYGFFLGAPIFCYIIHRTKALELGVIISLFVFLICFLLIKIGIFSVGGLSVILWILGFFSSSQLIIFYAALFTVPYRHSCLSVSIVNMFVTISIMLFHFYVALTTQYEREVYFFYDPMNLLILFFTAMLIYLTYLYKRGELSFIN